MKEDTKEFNIGVTQDDVNEIVEINPLEEEEMVKPKAVSESTPVVKPPKKKKDNIFKVLKNKWDGLSKKTKIITIVVTSIVLIALVVTLILVLGKDKEEVKEDVILQADNYRYENGKLFFLDNKSKDIGEYTCENKSQDLCYVAYSSNEDNFDVTKNVYEDDSIISERMKIISDDYVFVYDNEKDAEEPVIQLYSIKDNAKSEEYTLVKQYKNSKYIIAKDKSNKYGVLEFVNGEYNEKIAFSYDYLGFVNENKLEYLISKKIDKWYLMDIEGKEKSLGSVNEIKSYSEKYYSAINSNDLYELYDLKGKKVLNKEFNYINFIDDYIFTVTENKLYIYDADLNKVNSDGIQLNNKFYNLTNTYEKKSGKLISSDYAFKAQINNDTIELSIKNGEEEETTMINALEGAVSSDYAFVNYSNGQLFVYSDEAKTDLLGTYTCTNQNNITSGNDTLKNCYIADNVTYSKNEMTQATPIGTLPVFNNRFVFIKDVPNVVSEETMNIVLYDLKSGKALGKYKAIDALNNNKSGNLSFVEGTDILVIAKNTKNYFGILKINLSSVVALNNVKFADKFKAIEKIGDNFLIQNSENKYYLIDNTGKSLTTQFDSKIVLYKTDYVKLENGNEFKFDGSGLVPDIPEPTPAPTPEPDPEPTPEGETEVVDEEPESVESN